MSGNDNSPLNMVTTYNSSSLFYLKSGNGKKVLLLFHGFGQDHKGFKPLMDSLKDEYTCYAFDLYFHGQSQWAQGEQPLEKQLWKETLDTFLRENQIDQFSVLGFSLGGKFALASVEQFPERIQQLFLVAADGVKTSFWYWLATYPFSGRKLFKSMITHPNRFFSIGRFFHRIGLLENGVLRFAESQMNTEAKRLRVYYSWVVFRHLDFSMKTIARLLNQFEIQTTILVGKYDKVIPSKNMTRLITRLQHGKLEVAEVGHNQLLSPRVMQSIFPNATKGDNQR